MTAQRPTYRVTERAGHVEVTGLSASEVTEALHLLGEARTIQSSASAALTGSVLRSLVERATEPLLTPERMVAAQRLAAHRAALLDTPWFTHRLLAEVRGNKVDATRAWVRRHARAGDVFVVVKHAGRTVIPAFQFTDDGQVRNEIAAVTKILRDSAEEGLTGWEIWAWWTARTGYLSGEIPLDLVEQNPDRVRRAAEVSFTSTVL